MDNMKLILVAVAAVAVVFVGMSVCKKACGSCDTTSSACETKKVERMKECCADKDDSSK